MNVAYLKIFSFLFQTIRCRCFSPKFVVKLNQRVKQSNIFFKLKKPNALYLTHPRESRKLCNWFIPQKYWRIFFILYTYSWITVQYNLSRIFFNPSSITQVASLPKETKPQKPHAESVHVFPRLVGTAALGATLLCRWGCCSARHPLRKGVGRLPWRAYQAALPAAELPSSHPPPSSAPCRMLVHWSSSLGVSSSTSLSFSSLKGSAAVKTESPTLWKLTLRRVQPFKDWLWEAQITWLRGDRRGRGRKYLYSH